jgi:hypothetical protein
MTEIVFIIDVEDDNDIPALLKSVRTWYEDEMLNISIDSLRYSILKGAYK